MEKAKAFVRRSLDSRETFWAEQASLIDWHRPYNRVFDDTQPPFSPWFLGGETNLCHNAVDRHADNRPDAPALHYISSETGEETTYSFSDLKNAVMACAAMLQDLGVSRGERVLIYMPMVPEAVFAMLASVRLGAVHSVVFGGFASQALADRIDDLRPKVILTADAGLRGGKVIAYGPLLKCALDLCSHRPDHIVMKDRRKDPAQDLVALGAKSYDEFSAKAAGRDVPCVWLGSDEPSYVLYTSGTTGKPKGIERDTGGHAVGLVASMRYVYDAHPGETFFATSDIGWVVGHSYIVYGPLLNGMATILYEGTPVYPDAGIWWRIMEQYKPTVVFSSPTAMRVLKSYDEQLIRSRDLSSIRRFFLAGEPLDEATARWASDVLSQDVYDHCWQTETGWPVIAPLPGVEQHALKWGSPSFPVFGYDVQIMDETTGKRCMPGEKGMLAVKWPLPPGSMRTIWGDDERFKSTYFQSFDGQLYYLTYDFAVQDEDGYVFLLGRSDDVINVAGHRLGTKEIEGTLCTHPGVAEAAVVGVEDGVKGQMPFAFVVTKPNSPPVALDDLKKTIDGGLGAIARPKNIVFVPALPKTRSGKVLRRALQALAEGQDPGELPTLEDNAVLEAIKTRVSMP
ncbi:MAG: propionate--CoA ligase [Pseudomonadota bacterium]